MILDEQRFQQTWFVIPPPCQLGKPIYNLGGCVIASMRDALQLCSLMRLVLHSDGVVVGPGREALRSDMGLLFFLEQQNRLQSQCPFRWCRRSEVP